MQQDSGVRHDRKRHHLDMNNRTRVFHNNRNKRFYKKEQTTTLNTAPKILTSRTNVEHHSPTKKKQYIRPRSSSATTTPTVVKQPGEVRVLRSSERTDFIVDSMLRIQSDKSMKFMNENLEICLENIYKVLSEKTDYTVIGVLGEQGVGKSKILNEFSGKKLVFEVQNTLESKHQTQGIDMYITSDRCILLDTQPLYSASILCNLLMNDSKLSTDAMSFENQVDLLVCYKLQY